MFPNLKWLTCVFASSLEELLTTQCDRFSKEEVKPPLTPPLIY